MGVCDRPLLMSVNIVVIVTLCQIITTSVNTVTVTLCQIVTSVNIVVIVTLCQIVTTSVNIVVIVTVPDCYDKCEQDFKQTHAEKLC